jgi:hypothetical protein
MRITVRLDKLDKPIEGQWIRPIAEIYPSVHFVVYSATLLEDDSLFESKIPDDLHLLPNVTVTPFSNPGRAQECPGILTFIIENYYKLPDISIFVHGFPWDHNAFLEQQLMMFFRLNNNEGLPDFQFLHLNFEIFNS